MDDDNNIALQLRAGQEQVRAAMEAFRRRNRHLSGDQLELEWIRFCESPGAPEKPRTSSWTGCPGSFQVTVRSDHTTGEDAGLIFFLVSGQRSTLDDDPERGTAHPALSCPATSKSIRSRPLLHAFEPRPPKSLRLRLAERCIESGLPTWPQTTTTAITKARRSEGLRPL
jgi:hypothetical protein